ncbi:hypothetical protein P4U97_08375 [Bacillus swezeyi]|uniref:hypothetical protein n=1 Tax=Bacillus swezeyi TaxID=1925020 RepID=UPI002E228E58|nr:hypothetical protein [Bacillus swezeyi]
MKRKVQKKLFELCFGEGFAVVYFPILWIWSIDLLEWTKPYLMSIPSLFAFALLEFLLLQGSLYWYLKYKRVKQNSCSDLSPQIIRLFLLFKRLNLMLVGAGFLIFIYQIQNKSLDLMLYIFLYVFAVIEYINYYHIRLSYLSIEEIKLLMRQRGPRSSLLAKELRRSRGIIQDSSC